MNNYTQSWVFLGQELRGCHQRLMYEWVWNLFCFCTRNLQTFINWWAVVSVEIIDFNIRNWGTNYLWNSFLIDKTVTICWYPLNILIWHLVKLYCISGQKMFKYRHFSSKIERKLHGSGRKKWDIGLNNKSRLFIGQMEVTWLPS